MGSIPRTILFSLSLLVASQLAAQCDCPAEDSTAISGFVRVVNCQDAWFKHYHELAESTTNDNKRRKYLKKAFLFKPGYPGVLEQYIVEADQKDLRLLREILRCMLKNHALLNSEVVTYNLALAYVQYRLGAYGDAYQNMLGGISREAFCKVEHATTQALICNNLGVLQLHYQGTNNMYRTPIKPFSTHDVAVTIGMLDSASSILPGDTVVTNNRDRLPNIAPVPFNRYRCVPSHPRYVNDSLVALHRKDSIRTAKYCASGLFDVHYDSLYNHLEQFDEIVFLHDVSGSMDTVTTNTRGLRRMDLANQLLECLTYDLAYKELGLVSVGNLCGTMPRHLYPVPEYDTVRFRSEMACCDVFGETPLRERLEGVDTLFLRPNSKKLAFLLTDGMDNCTSPFDLCELSKQMFDKGIYLSILHLLPDEPQYDDIKDIYHCMTDASRSNVYRLAPEGTIQREPPHISRMPYLKVGQVRLCNELDDEGKKACRCRPGIIGCMEPDSERWSKGNTWGKGATDPVTKVDCRIPRIPWQCKYLNRLPKEDRKKKK